MDDPTRRDRASVRVAVLALLGVHAILLARVGYLNSPTLDEVGHLPAGISHWVSGRFDLYRVNPPLVRSLAAVPVLLAGPRMSWGHYFDGPYSRTEFTLGHDFIQANGVRAFWLFTLARWACIPLSLIGGWACYRWATELYGRRSGLLALCLWCFGPNVIGNAAMITPDAGAAALGCLAGYTFWRWLRAPDWRRAAFAGLALGFAELTKTTWVVLFGLWPLLWVTWRSAGGGRAPGSEPPADEGRDVGRRGGASSAPGQGCQMAVILLLGLYVINLGYGFAGTMTRLKDYTFISESMTGRGPRGVSGGNRFAGGALGQVPVPFPKDYVRGIDMQKRDFERGLSTYLGGEQRRPGWWYYYLYAAAVKVPLGTWFLGALALGMTLHRRPPLADALDGLALWAPALTVFIMVSSQTGINRHFRYVLPALPFLLVWVSKVGRVVDPRRRAASAVVLGSTAFAVVSSLAVYPHSLSYFNEAVGGPTGGPAHLLDSNIDWGQDLLTLRRWMAAHPEARGLKLAYFGNVTPRSAGIDAREPPHGPIEPEPDPGLAKGMGPQPGWVAVSVNLLRGYRHDDSDPPHYTYFRHFRPVATAGYSIYIYHITPDEANRVRERLRLPPLEPPSRPTGSR